MSSVFIKNTWKRSYVVEDTYELVFQVVSHNLPNLIVSRGNRMDWKFTIAIVLYIVFLVLRSRKKQICLELVESYVYVYYV